MDTTTVIPDETIRDRLTDPTDGRPVDLADLSPVDAAGILVDVHGRVERLFGAYEQAEGSHVR